MGLYADAMALEKAVPVPKPLRDLRPGRGVSLLGGRSAIRSRSDRELLKLDREGPPAAALALNTHAMVEGAAQWAVWGPVAGRPRARALDVKGLIMKAATPQERIAICKQAQIDGEVEPKPGHPWEVMIRRGTVGVGEPWMWMTGDAMMALFKKHTQAIGEHCALIGRTPVSVGGRRKAIPTTLFPLVPTWLQLPTLGREDVFEIATGAGVNEFVPARDVMWYRIPAMEDPYGRGVGAMQPLADDLELDESQAKYLNAIHESIGQVRQMLIFPNVRGTPAEDDIRMALEKTRGSRRGARMTALYPEAGMENSKVQQIRLGETPADLAVYDSRAANRDTILRTNQVAPGAVGVSLDVNRANAQVQRENLRDVQKFSLEQLRSFHQARFFEPLGNEPAEYFGEDRLFVMWHLGPLRDPETARILMRAVPEMFTEEQMWEVAGFEGGDPNRRPAPKSRGEQTTRITPDDLEE